jgi:hypothetical protein
VRTAASGLALGGAIRPGSLDRMLNNLMVAMFVLAGTGLQMTLSLREIAGTKRKELQVKNAEDQLVAELPRMQRRAARRAFIRERAPEVHQAIRDAWLHVLAWALLFGAAAAASFDALIGR